MPSITVTITDITQKPQSIYNLITLPSTSLPGYTVVPSAPANPNVATLIASVNYLSLQASYTNAGGIVYKGDQGVKTDGSRQSKELAAGDTDVQQAYSYSTNLNQIYLTANTNGMKVNVEYHHG